MIGKPVTKLSIVFLLLVLVSVFALLTSTELDPPQKLVHLRDAGSWNPCGPYVDRAIFKVITGPDVQVQALLDGEIDHLADNVEAEYLSILEAEPDIEVTLTERLGFGFMAINCERYPYNFPGFRRALAFALDKHALAQDMWGDLGFALDSPIPASCGVWHNSQTTPDFRDSNIIAARAELAQAGFFDLDGDGYVEAPNGDQIIFRPMHYIESPRWGAALTSQLPYWDAAGIRVLPMPLALGTLLDIIFSIPRNYDAACYEFSVHPIPLILKRFISEEINNPNYEGNILNWGNSTYDEWVEVMMTASGYTEVLEAAHMAQQVIVENAPMIVMYGKWDAYAYRTDKYEGWVEVPGWGTGYRNHWTLRKVQLKEGQPERDPFTGCGGTFRITSSWCMDSQNPLTSSNVGGGRYRLFQVYSSLTGFNDDEHQSTKQNGGLAYDWTVQSHPYGLNYTFTLFDNATWHDLGGANEGFVTADDVAFSYNYILEHNIPTHSYGIPYLNSCRALDDTHVEIITNGDSYWAFDLVRGWVILPEHSWSGVVSPMTFTNPQPVGCGPFKWYRRVEGDYVELHYWENYHKGIPGHGTVIFNPLIPLAVYITGGVIVIAITLIGSGFYLYLSRKKSVSVEKKVELLEPEGDESSTELIVCPHCGVGINREDQFCAGCGQQISE